MNTMGEGVSTVLPLCMNNGTFLSQLVNCTNATGNQVHNATEDSGEGGTLTEHVVSVVVGVCFGFIGLVGLFGNSLVILGESSIGVDVLLWSFRKETKPVRTPFQL